MKVRASAAATIGNVGPGYDVLGLCLEGPRDVVEVETTATGTVEIRAVRGDGGRLSTKVEANCAGVAARAVLETFGPPGVGVSLVLHKGLPLGSGLGSSGASSVAGAVATAAAVCPDVPRAALLDACREGERAAIGEPVPDNVAPSLLGGIVACLPREGERVEAVRLPVPAPLHAAVVKPDVSVSTAVARAILPDAVPMATAVFTSAQIAGLVAALASGDLELLGRCLDDRLVTPYRKQLIPGYDAAMDAALAAGALGGGISGSGPTLFALTDSLERAQAAAQAMIEAFRAHSEVEAFAHAGRVDAGGARVERQR